MSETQKKLKRIQSMAASLYYATDELMDELTVENNGSFVLKDEKDEDTYITIGGLHSELETFMAALAELTSKED